MNFADLLARPRGLNLQATPPQPAPIMNGPMNPMQIAQILQDSPPDVGQLPPMDESLLDFSYEQGDGTRDIPITRIAPQIQEWLGTKKPDEGGLVRQILSMRRNPTSEDAARAATDTLTSGKYVSSTDRASLRIKEDMDAIKSISDIQNAAKRVDILGSGGNSVFALTMDAINSDPELSKLSMMDKIRLAQNKLGTNLTIDANGQVSDMSGAAAGLGNLEFGKQSGQNQSDLLYEPQITAANKTAQLSTEKLFDAPKALNSLNATKSSHEYVIGEIGRTIPMVNVWTAGTVGSPLSSLPGTPAANLRNALDGIKANIGFDKLAEMRANSPTGGALGNVSDSENRLLAATWGSVEQSNSPQQLRDNLTRLQQQIVRANQRLAEAYQRDFGSLEGAPQLNAQAPTQNLQVTPEDLQFMTPEERALFGQ